MLVVLLKYLIRLPFIIFLILKDYIIIHLTGEHKRFTGWGLHIYVGRFGAGKTLSMVQRAYVLCQKYKELTVVTNVSLAGFPKWTKILPLRKPEDITNAPPGSLILIDEIGTIFNSRDFAASKGSVPKILFQHLCQCRKRRMQILATTQKWNFLDKQLRDIAATVNVTRSHLGHPYSRACTVWTYDADEYDMAYTNPMIPLKPLANLVYIQTNHLRSLYDTSSLVTNMLNDDYISDADILAARGDLTQPLDVSSAKSKKRTFNRFKKNR